MKYMGSKSKIAKYIVPIIQKKIDESGSSTYIEPFVGGCNVIDKIKAKHRIASDKNKYLIELFKHLQRGGELPESVTREEYNRVRENKEAFPDWYVGAVGFLASYNGRFFDGGYAGFGKANGRIRDYYKESKNNILKQARNGIRGIEFLSTDYREFDPVDCVIYCDPPYEGKKKYANSKNFNHEEFWEKMRDWSRNNIVIISEQNAPEDFMCIWEKEVSRSIKATEKFKATEKLFILKAEKENETEKLV